MWWSSSSRTGVCPASCGCRPSAACRRSTMWTLLSRCSEPRASTSEMSTVGTTFVSSPTVKPILVLSPTKNFVSCLKGIYLDESTILFLNIFIYLAYLIEYIVFYYIALSVWIRLTVQPYWLLLGMQEIPQHSNLIHGWNLLEVGFSFFRHRPILGFLQEKKIGDSFHQLTHI